MIALGCDHGGYELMQEVKKHLEERDLEYKDYGCNGPESVDYPVYGKKVAEAIVNGECEKGILICGTGIGNSKESVPHFVRTALLQKRQDFITMPIFWLWEVV